MDNFEKWQIPVIEIEEIPDIELYMDQVTSFMENKLSSCKRDDADKILTKTMINNYAKAGLFPPPYKKKYGRSHMMFLIIIYHLKNVLSIGDIKRTLEPVKESCMQGDDRFLTEVYASFLEIQKAANEAVFTNSIRNFSYVCSSDAPYAEFKDILSVLSLSVLSESQKFLSEKIIDERFKN